MSDRDELAGVVSQVHAWAELDRLFGVGSSVAPRLAPAPPATRAPVAAVAVRAPAPAVVLATPTAVDPALDARRKENAPRLAAIAARLQGCTRCELSGGRTNLVMGQGDPAAELVFVGEGPGETEDRTGLAFVGPAGELLTKMIIAMGLTRDEVFIANVVKCRPPGNRTPQPQEMATCLPFLEEQLAVIQPRVICALGKTAAVGLGLMKADEPVGRIRGTFQTWNGAATKGVPVMVTYHPSYLLRSPSEKRKTWEDLQKIFPLLTRRRSG